MYKKRKAGYTFVVAALFTSCYSKHAVIDQIINENKLVSSPYLSLLTLASNVSIVKSNGHLSIFAYESVMIVVQAANGFFLFGFNSLDE